MDICCLVPSPNTELQFPNSNNFILDDEVICEPSALKLCLALWASAVLEIKLRVGEAGSSAHAVRHPDRFCSSLLKLSFPSTGEPVQIAMSLDIASISSISESDMVSEIICFVREENGICLRDSSCYHMFSTETVIFQLLCFPVSDHFQGCEEKKAHLWLQTT